MAGMTPTLTAGEFAFCATRDRELIARASPGALGWFREEEGTTLILPLGEARTLGFTEAMSMRRIVLEVFSALDGVGLTEGVVTALARANIPCNIVAAYHHDHVFVPAALAERACAVLIGVAARAKAER
ncbi:MAG: ACT domain-containing protein [Parvibaculaceae bacterium]